MTNHLSLQNYPWGKTGKNSIAARLCAGTPDTGFEIQDDQPYAEMWMGDYVSGFSQSDPPLPRFIDRLPLLASASGQGPEDGRRVASDHRPK